ncbi:MAG: hypothetical protein QOD70_1602 [Frankiales bacterium]|jgi:hypothetical protein|nr:hypothetical protein [Frankiales bacterium]
MTFDQRRIYLTAFGLIVTLACAWYVVTDFSLLPVLGLVGGLSLTYLAVSGQALRRREGDETDPRNERR